MNLSMLGTIFHYNIRSLWRHRGRSFAAVSMVAIAVFIALTAIAYAQSVILMWAQASIETGTSDLQISVKGFRERQDGIDPTFGLDQSLIEKLKTDLEGKAQALSPRFYFEGLIFAHQKSTFFFGQGVNGKDELRVSPQLFNPQHDQGIFVTQENSQGATVSRTIAELIDLKLGDSVTLVAPTEYGSVNAIDATIMGIVDVPLPSFPAHTLFVNIDQALRLTKFTNLANTLAVRLNSSMTPEQISSYLDQEFPDRKLIASSWRQTDPLIAKIEKSWHAIALIFSALLGLSAILTLMGVLYLMINERIVEVGTLMALGAPRWIVTSVFIADGAIIGFLGSSIGVLLTTILLVWTHYQGLNFQSPFSDRSVLIYPQPDLSLALQSIGICILVGGGVSFFPSKKAANLNPIKALRGEIA